MVPRLERRISNLRTPDLMMKHEVESPSSSIQSSARVLQLKREIEDLDARLSHSNTMNFDEIRASIRYEVSQLGNERPFMTTNKHQDNVNRQYDQIKWSVSHQSNSKKMNTVQRIDPNSHYIDHQDPDISFVDMEKIRESRDNYLARAFESNLQQKKKLINEL